MNTIQRGVITLIKSAVTGEKLTLPEDFSLEEAMEQIARHGLHAICYQGAYLCGIPKDGSAMRTLFGSYCRSMVHSERQMAAVSAVFDAFEKNGIDYMPLKGVNLKPLYPKPELRSMGDADVLIRMEQYEKIVPIMESLGFQFTEETDHELPWRSKDLYLELHKRLIPSYNLDYHAYYGDGWQLGKEKTGHRYAMTAEDAYLYIFSHYAKHYRDGGIGCRHVTDLWVWRRTHPDMDESYIRGELEKLQLEAFHSNTMKLLELWFGEAQPEELTEFMTDYIFVSGNYGLLENRTLSFGVKTMKTARSAKWERVKQLWGSLFPGHAIIDKQYPVLVKHPWLLPIFWVVRLFDKLLFQRKAVERRKRSLKVFNQKNIDSHREALRYVGLDYNF